MATVRQVPVRPVFILKNVDKPLDTADTVGYNGENMTTEEREKIVDELAFMGSYARNLVTKLDDYIDELEDKIEKLESDLDAT